VRPQLGNCHSAAGLLSSAHLVSSIIAVPAATFLADRMQPSDGLFQARMATPLREGRVLVSFDRCTFAVKTHSTGMRRWEGLWSVHAGEDADLIIYVTNQRSALCGNTTLASAAACAFDPVTNRPIAGNIIFCQINPDLFNRDLVTAVHELLHVLVRSLQEPAHRQSMIAHSPAACRANRLDFSVVGTDGL
jgi:hypothetical protein